MKKIGIFLFLATCTLQATIYIDQETEQQFRKSMTLAPQECRTCQTKLNTKFTVCQAYEHMEKRVHAIDLGKLTSDSSYQTSVQLANNLMEQIETFDDYKAALKQAKNFNVQESWRILQEVVSQHARELVSQQTTIIFPSLDKNYKDLHQRLIEFAQANQNTDIEKNTHYLEAIGLIVYHFRQMQKDHLAKNIENK